MEKYADIINLPHHTSQRHPRMPRESRAAQFAPFAALTGYEGAIKEAARLTDKKISLSEEQINALNEKLLYLRDMCGEAVISVTYFVRDPKKEGGKYVSYEGELSRIDEAASELIFKDRRRIKTDALLFIELL